MDGSFFTIQVSLGRLGTGFGSAIADMILSEIAWKY